jgi:hypothetical protein
MERFRDAIEYTGKFFAIEAESPNTDTVSRQCQIQVHRVRFCEHLIRHGIEPRKTRSLTGPADTVPSHLLRHWWRGFFDGDGSVGFSDAQLAKGTKRAWNIGIVGTEAVCRSFTAFVDRECGVRLNIYSRRGNMQGKAGEVMWTAKVAGVQSPQKVARLLYADATVFLERKKHLIDVLLATVPKRDRSAELVLPNRVRQRGEKNVVNTLLTCNGVAQPVKAWVRQLNLADSTVHNRLKRGDSPERSLRKPRPVSPPKFNKPITAFGETLTIPQWSKKLSLGRTTIRFRLEKGEAPEQVLRPVGKVLYQGKWYSVSALARLVNINRTTLKYRLDVGQSVEVAIGTV